MGLQERTKARQRRAFAMTERMPGRAIPSQRQQRRQPYGCRLSLSRKVRTSRQRGGRVCAGNPGRVSCTMMIPIFQSF